MKKKTEKLSQEQTQIAWWVSGTPNGKTSYQKKPLKKGTILTIENNRKLEMCGNGFHSCSRVLDTARYNNGNYLWMVRIPKNTTGVREHRSNHDGRKSVSTYREHVDVEKIEKTKVIETPLQIIEKTIAKLKLNRKLVAPIVFEILASAKKRGYMTSKEAERVFRYCDIKIDYYGVKYGKIKNLSSTTYLKEAQRKILARQKA